jgi:PAS domain S-box-containing protein
MVLDRNWRYTYFSEHGARMIGMRREDLVGGCIWEIFRHAEGTKFYEGYHRAMETGQPATFEEYYPEPLNKWFECHCYPSETGLSVYFQDVTERRRAEEALRESESRLRTLSDNLPEGAIYRYRHDAQGEPHIDFISAGIERLTGVPAAEYMADHATMYRNILPEDHDRLKAAIALSRDRLEQFEVEVRHPHRATGEIRWSLLRSTPSRNPDGSVVWDGIELDITERRRAEAKLAERTMQLESAAGELEERNRQVERVNRMKTEFLSRSSHELRTPLNAIVGYSELLSEQSAGPLPPPYPRFVANIQEGARHLVAMVNDLLDISRIEAGHIDLNREAFHPANVLEEVLSVMAPLANIKNISIENAIPAGMSIRADRTRFKQVLFNLFSNAVKFTPENGRVWIAEASREDAAGFCVGDTGIGIPNSDLESVFDEFHQVSGPSNVAKEGTGLGLAIARRLVELHGGTIGVESTVGQGSRFIFSLGANSLEPPNAAPAT